MTYIKSKYFSAFALVALGLSALSYYGCFKGGANREAKVVECRVNNYKEDPCNAATQQDNRRCHFDKVTRMCAPLPQLPPVACKKLSADACRASKFCTYIAANPECEDADPALKGTCEVIQSDDACNADATCRWNMATAHCDAKVYNPRN